MHIAFLTSEYPHKRVTHAAGIATSIKNLVVALSEKGVKASVFVYAQKEDAVFNEDKVKIHLIKKRSYKFMGWFWHRKYIEKYLNSYIVSESIDAVEAPDWTGITAFMRFKVPLIIRFHGSDAYFCKLDKRKQKFKNFLFEKWALKNASAYIAPTAFAGIETQKIFGLNKKKIKTIHYGLQLKDFKNETPLIYNRTTIIYIGTIIRKKGVLELAEIFNKVIESNPEAQLILIGNDSPDLKTGISSTYTLVKSLFSNEAKKNVNYLGKIPYSEVKNHIKNAHLCVFPSFAETLGMVTIESMALQKPVVNTSIGWAQELIDNGVNGFLVHPTDIDFYAQRILELLNDESMSGKVGIAAREKVEALFDIDKIADINIGYYKSIIE
ncbi:Glycosyltransferase involved in cell wall bisynthesis [Flaviramulus basaltis]|uniref:Glycosyltransferase involved in cell wall bisynthesis n=1 Tax=Flaviramulus basaltis TaxID=369401 RepID=A0A1K2IKV1_9FLAO|nr:glycosyltransferase family 4 protein [Flaviramulus basaltis]SFZ92934.1 Glycosyltransferase involved in cell wall bisynthesis [Flaviramulus basaltis]